MSATLISTTSNYMAAHIEKYNPEKSIKAWEEVHDSISLNKLNSSMALAIYTNLSDSYFMLGKYHDALKWVNKILNFKEKNIFDLQAITRIYVLLVHYELGNYDMLPYIAKSSKRFLIKHNYFSEFEKIMIHFFEKEISKTNNQREQSEVFVQLRKQLEELLKNTKQIQALDYFDYMSWIESKIENRPFVEIVKSRQRTDSQGAEKVQLSSIEK